MPAIPWHGWRWMVKTFPKMPVICMFSRALTKWKFNSRSWRNRCPCRLEGIAIAKHCWSHQSRGLEPIRWKTNHSHDLAWTLLPCRSWWPVGTSRNLRERCSMSCSQCGIESEKKPIPPIHFSFQAREPLWSFWWKPCPGRIRFQVSRPEWLQTKRSRETL